MANIPTNSSYTGTGNTQGAVTGTGNVPTSLYDTIAKLRDSYNPLQQAVANPTNPYGTSYGPGARETYDQSQSDVFQYGNLLNFGQGVKTGTQFLPPEDPKAPIPIGPDYGVFRDMSPGEISGIQSSGLDLRWGMPKDPIIRNIPGDVPGQYVQDRADPELLVKTERGENIIADKAILAGRSPSLYQIDHVLPLALGGGDTLGNRQLLTIEEHERKTKAQSVAYTLYAHKKISLADARAMAMSWKDKDVEDIPMQNDVGLIPDQAPAGMFSFWKKPKTGLEIAMEYKDKWLQPKEVTAKDVIAGIPGAFKNLGDGWLPSAVSEFVKGFTSGATAGIVPYVPDDDMDLADKTGMIGGFIVGSLIPWAIAGKILSVPLRAMGAYRYYGGYKMKEIVEKTSLFNKALPDILKSGGTALGRSPEAVQAAIAQNAQNLAFKKLPNFVQRVTNNPVKFDKALELGLQSVLTGYGVTKIGGNLNAYELSGTRPLMEGEEGIAYADPNERHKVEYTIGQALEELAFGAFLGGVRPTIKGTMAMMSLPATMSLLHDPDNVEDALISGAMFGALHLHGVMRVPTKPWGKLSLPKFKVPEGFNDIESFGGRSYSDPLFIAIDTQTTKMAEQMLKYMAPNVDIRPMSIDKYGRPIYNPADLEKALLAAQQNISKIAGLTAAQEAELVALRAHINKTLDNGQVKQPSALTVLAKNLTPSGRESLRKQATTENEAQKEIASIFGVPKETLYSKLKGTVTKKSEPTPAETPAPAAKIEALDLGDAQLAMKRAVIAARHLYKVGLPTEPNRAGLNGIRGELRSKADLEDMFSVTRDGLQKKHMESLGLIDRVDNPLAVRYAAGAMSVDPSLARKAFGKGARVKDTFNWKQADAAQKEARRLRNETLGESRGYFAGAGMEQNSGRVAEYIRGIDDGTSSRYIIIKKRPELEGTFRMKNDSYDPKEIESGKVHIDPNPGNAYFGYGFRKNKNNINVVQVGTVAGDHRLNNPGDGINSKDWVQEKGLTVKLSKDNTFDKLFKEVGEDVLIVEAKIYAPERNVTTADGDVTMAPSYMFFEVNPTTQAMTKRIAEISKSNGYKTPVERSIEKAKDAVVEGKTLEEQNMAVKEMIDNPNRSEAAEYLPKYDKGTELHGFQSVTKAIFNRIGRTLDVENPQQLREAFKADFGIDVPPKVAETLHARNQKGELSVGEMYDYVNMRKNEARKDVAVAIEMSNMYVKNGPLEFEDPTGIIMKMPVNAHPKKVKPVEAPRETVAVKQEEPALVGNNVREIKDINDINKGDRIRIRNYDREAPITDGGLSADPYTDSYATVVARSAKTGGVGLKIDGEKELTWINKRNIENQFGVAYEKVTSIPKPATAPEPKPTESIQKPTVSIEKPTENVQKPTVSIEKPTAEGKKNTAIQEKPTVVYGKTGRKRENGTDIYAQYNSKTNTITIDKEAIKKDFDNKPWTKPKVDGVKPLPEGQFKDADEWLNFNLKHEMAHVNNPRKNGETTAGYENRMNKIALNSESPRLGKVVVEMSSQKDGKIENRISNSAEKIRKMLKAEDDIISRGKDIIYDAKSYERGGHYEPETIFTRETDIYGKSIFEGTSKMRKSDRKKVRQSISPIEHLAYQRGVINDSMSAAERNAVLAKWNPGSGGAFGFAKSMITKIYDLNTSEFVPKGGSVRKIKQNAIDRLTNDIVLKVSESFNMPLEDANAVVLSALGKRVLRGRSGVDKDGNTIWKNVGDEIVVPKPKGNIDIVAEANAKSIFDAIESGKNNFGDTIPDLSIRYFSKSLDLGFKTLFGEGYKKNKQLQKLLHNYFRYEFFAQTNVAGRELTQTKDWIDARALGNKAAANKAIAERNSDLKKYESELYRDTKYGAEDSELKVDIERGPIKMDVQNDNMVGDLTRGEVNMGGLWSDKATMKTNVLSIRDLFLGTGKFGSQKSGKTPKGLFMYLQEGGIPMKADYKTLAKKFNELAPLAEAEETRVLRLIKAREKKAAEIAADKSKNEMQVPHVKRLLEVYRAALKDLSDRPAWVTPEVQKAWEGKAVNLEKKLNTLTDGGGGPGVKDGKGGIGDLWGGIKNMFGVPQTVYNPLYYTPEGTKKSNQSAAVIGALQNQPQLPKEVISAPKINTYNVRDKSITDDDINEAAHILYGEISNRPPERQQFEARHIVNTAINRMGTPSGYGKDVRNTLRGVLQEPAQYQAYAPEGMTVKGGKIVESQYQRSKAGKLSEGELKKFNAILEVLNEIKTGKFDDSTDGSMFYVHASDGTMWLGKTVEEAKRNANAHEKRSKGHQTQWGTAVGLGAHLTQR